MNHHENPGTARTSSDASNNPDRNFPATLCETGLEHMLAGRLLDAQRCCREALALDANDADALHLMGLLCFQASNSITPWSGWSGPSGKIQNPITSQNSRDDAGPPGTTRRGAEDLRQGGAA